MNGRWGLMLCVAAILGVASCREEDERRPVSGTDAAVTPDQDAGPGEADGGEACCAIWGACLDAAAGPATVDTDGDGSPADVDCDDHDAARYPGFGGPGEEGPWGAPTCCDGKDNDCDGVVDGAGIAGADGCCNVWAPCMEAAGGG